MKTTIKAVLSIVIFHLLVAYIKWDFKWYLAIPNLDEDRRLLFGMTAIVATMFFYYLLHLIEKKNENI